MYIHHVFIFFDMIIDTVHFQILALMNSFAVSMGNVTLACQFKFLLNVSLVENFLDHIIILFSLLSGTSTLLCMMSELIYIPTNGSYKLIFFNLLTNSFCVCLPDSSHPNRGDVLSHTFNTHFCFLWVMIWICFTFIDYISLSDFEKFLLRFFTCSLFFCCCCFSDCLICLLLSYYLLITSMVWR